MVQAEVPAHAEVEAALSSGPMPLTKCGDET
jgi:hypothetical protein